MLFDEEVDGAGETGRQMWRAAADRLHAMAPGAVLRLYSDDPAAKAVVPHLCEEAGHQLVGRIPRPEGWHFFIRKG